MIDPDPRLLSEAIALAEPIAFRTIPFDRLTFDLLKALQRKLEGHIKRDTDNPEVLKYLLMTHPEAQQATQ